jgi:hypothetical protein
MLPTSYTVRVVNEALGKDHFTGSFDSIANALTYAEKQAQRSRSFVTFQVWCGTPRNPLNSSSNTVRGQS